MKGRTERLSFSRKYKKKLLRKKNRRGKNKRRNCYKRRRRHRGRHNYRKCRAKKLKSILVT
jgi:hypothetical protein